MATSPLKYDKIGPSLKEMSNTDIDAYISCVIGADFANTTGVGSLGVGSLTNGTSIGTWVDTYFLGTVGDKVASNTATTISTTLYQDLTSATGTATRPLHWRTGGGVKQMIDADIDSTISAKVASYIANGGIGSYVLQPTAPATGTWVSRGSLTNTLETGETTTTYLWQKTADSNIAIIRPLKYVSASQQLQEMSDAEIQSLTYRVRNYIISSGIGKYALSTSAPVSGGTWVMAGAGFDDTRRTITLTPFATSYTPTFTGAYTGGYGSITFSGLYSGNFTGTYAGAYTGQFTGAYSKAFATTFTGVYATNFTGIYAGSFTRAFTGVTTFTGIWTGSFTSVWTKAYTGVWSKIFTSSTFTRIRTTTRTTYATYGTGRNSWTGSRTFNGFFTGAYTGATVASYTGSFTGIYNQSYTGIYSRTFTGIWAGSYSRAFTGSFTGIYVGNFTGLYNNTFTGTFSGVYSQAFTGSYAGSYSQAFTGSYVVNNVYTGSYTGAYNSTYSGIYGAFTGSYISAYTGGSAFSALVIYATPETVQTTKLWVRTA